MFPYLLAEENKLTIIRDLEFYNEYKVRLPSVVPMLFSSLKSFYRMAQPWCHHQIHAFIESFSFFLWSTNRKASRILSIPENQLKEDFTLLSLCKHYATPLWRNNRHLKSSLPPAVRRVIYYKSCFSFSTLFLLVHPI